jgi:hypothetical protein
MNTTALCGDLNLLEIQLFSANAHATVNTNLFEHMLMFARNCLACGYLSICTTVSH